MKSSVILSMCLVMTIYFVKGVAPLPQKVETEMVNCKCNNGGSCVGTKSCRCDTGSCVIEACDKLNHFVFQAKKPGKARSGICDCPDGSHCEGTTCYCDGFACVASNDCDDETTATPAPIEDTTTPEIDGITTPEIDGIITPEIDGITTPEIDGITTPEIDGPTTPEIDGPTTPEIDGITTPKIVDTTSDESEDTTTDEINNTTSNC